MEIKIEYDSRPGLRIINSIVKGQLVWVRGFNGIGKTLAATVLVIASGGYKFENSKEFESLRDALKSVIITISVDENTIFKVHLLPAGWRFLKETLMVDDSTLGKFYFGDSEVSAEKFQRQFKAKIVKGNETLSTQIQEMINRNIFIFKEWEEQARRSLDSYENYVRDLLSRLQIDRLTILKEKMSKQRDLDEQISALQSRRKHQETMSEKLAIIREIDENIEFRESYTKETLETNFKQIQNQIEKSEAQIESLRTQRDALRSSIRQEIVSRRLRYDSLLSRSESLDREILRLRLQLFKTLQKLQISVELDKLGPIVVKTRIAKKQTEYRTEEDELKSQKDEVITKKHLHETAAGIKGILVSEQGSLAEEIIAGGYLENTSRKVELTVTELRELVENRIKQIQDELTKLDVGEADERLEKLNELFHQTESTLKANSTLEDRIQELARIKRTIEGFESSGTDDTQSASKKIQSLEKEIRKTQFNIFALQNNGVETKENLAKLKTVPSLDSLNEQRDAFLDSILKPLGLDGSTRITKEIVKSQKNAAEKLEYQIMETTESRNRISKEIDVNVRNIERLVNDASDSDEFSFLFQEIDVETPTVRKLEIVRDSLNDFVNYVDKKVLEITVIHIALQQMLEFQRRKEAVETYQSPEIGNTLEGIFNHEFLRNYSKEEYMKHVFRGFKEIVGFDLKNNEIQLKDNDGKTSTRLISAFSSGEKAFAFALAMISIFSRETADNKILFLDEFGALLDFVKENVLLRELEKEIFQARKIDKVVILLPVKSDLKKQLGDLTRSLDFVEPEEKKQVQSRISKLRSQAESLEKFGYFQYQTLTSTKGSS